MDEVDIDNLDDLNELESRLYAQIHHESTDTGCGAGAGLVHIDESLTPAPKTVRTVTETSVVNKLLGNKSGRYWSSGNSGQNPAKYSIKQPSPSKEHCTEIKESAAVPSLIAGNLSKPYDKSQLELGSETRNAASTKNTVVVQQEKFQTPKSQASIPSKSSTIQCPADQNWQKAKDQQHVIKHKANKDLRVNPAASWLGPKAKASKKQQRGERQRLPREQPAQPNLLKNAPFAKQVQKLNKARIIEAKKQKSKGAKAKKPKSEKTILETITVASTEESESDDVIMVPVPPLPTYTIDDSDEDITGKASTTSMLLIEENARDATDVDLEIPTTSFAKPKQTAAIDAADQQQPQHASRCTSPCSVLSSDDFIGQNDRCRLLEGSGMADDEDLLMLTADVDSLMEVPTNREVRVAAAQEKESKEHTDDSSNEVACTMFVPPTNASTTKNNYRVEQMQFRALDVYDSESDMTESVYAKGKKSKNTTIRTVDNSSSDYDGEEVDTSQKAKRYRKRRPSSSNKDGVVASNLSYISCGPAVERNVSKSKKITQSASSRRASVSSVGKISRSDHDFIATLNTLAQGGNDESNAVQSSDENSDSSDTLPSARAIAEQVLGVGKSQQTRTSAGVVTERNISESEQNLDHQNTGVLDNTLTKLDRIFKTVDQIDNRTSNHGNVLAVSQPVEDLEQSVIDVVNPADNDDEDLDGDTAPTARDIAEEVLAASKLRQSRATIEVIRESNCADMNAEQDEEAMSQSSLAVEDPDDNNGEISDYDIEQMFIADKAQQTSNQAGRSATAAATRFTAVPDNAVANLDKVFETIDRLDKRTRNNGIRIDISDDSEPEEEVVVTHPPMPSRAPTVSRNSRKKMNKETGDPVYNVIYSELNRFAGGLGWNDEMRRFYNDSWNGEHFNLGRVYSQLDPNKSLWKVYTEDRFPKTRRFMNLKCHNCCEFGHTRAKCTQPKKPLTCYMCGQRGHYEPRCPNTVCLRCGNKTHVFTKSCNACTFQNRLICPVCKVRGHTLNLCPDKWRRYHSTTKPNAYPNSRVEYKMKKYCCICGSRGHLSETCKSAVRFLEYPLYVSEIKSHQKSYNDQSIKSIETGIGFNLLYRPEIDVSFELAENTTSKDYYGRFLNAVGMGFLLKRKRTANSLSSSTPTSSKQVKKSHGKYVPNPYSKVGQKARNTTQEPEQVPEISESSNVEKGSSSDLGGNAQTVDSNLENEEITPTINYVDNEDLTLSTSQIVEGENNAAFKAPVVISVNTQAQSTIETEPMVMDSDSNYSFSEHFEASLSCAAGTHSEVQKTKSREMDPLPDFIPLNGDTSQEDENDSDVDLQAGISRKYVTGNRKQQDANEDDDAGTNSPLPDIPCEAKIYLTHFHSKYLLSPEGHSFLLEKSEEFGIKAHLDWTSVGHVLNIFGLQVNQDKFHRELLLKYRQLSDHMNRKRLESSQKVPRRADVLIRFLRENINQLMSNLGNVNELLKRLKRLEDQHTKAGWKSAEKARRSLNMILIGQAGLCDGSHHLDNLLLSLKKLINDYKGEDAASDELRGEIDTHWKAIFSSYQHNDYPELVQHYNRMLSKNRIPNLNIDPLLLGGRVIDSSLTKEQKARMENADSQKAISTPEKVASRQQTAGKEKHVKGSNVVPNPLNPKNAKFMQRTRASSPPPPAPSMKVKTLSPSSTAPLAPSMQLKGNQMTSFLPPTNSLKFKNNNVFTSPLKKSQILLPPFVNPEKKSNVAAKIQEVTKRWETTCDDLLKEIDDGGPKKGPVRDFKAPSMFWSRECLKYLDDCIKKVTLTNAGLTDKLHRVQTKSRSGLLSYNDYRAVIRLHNAIFRK